MRIQLERRSGAASAPVYQQIAAQIRREIDGEGLCAGSRLPPIRDLARQLGVNRDTVAQAYEQLVAAGLVESTVGRGTFVAPARSAEAPPGVAPAASFSGLTERLMAFERARPRFGSGQDAVPMHTLVPDPSLYPAEAFRNALDRVLSEGGAELLSYGGPQGSPRLREVLAAHFSRDALEVAASEIVLCHGASQGIALALRLFAEAGDAVALEDPTYNNALGAVLGLGMQPAPIPMREDGLDLDVLEQTLARPDVKALYTMPTFHNPMGTTAGLEHRRALLAIAERTGVPVIEDGYEMDLRFAGQALPPLAGLDTSGRVVHLFSFSKSLFPGARVGAITARGRCVEALLALKRATDLSDALPLQAALAEFLASGEYDRHLQRLRGVLRARCAALLESLAQEMPAGTRWTRPLGGYQVWVELPAALDTSELLADAVGGGVLFAPGAQFHSDGRASRCLRLTFAMADEAALRRGVARLAAIVRRRLAAVAPTAVEVHV
jgi:DNA-binding transcriptional MocR family regulator